MNEAEWCIWSHEHKQWWGPNRSGYTDDVRRAGVYSTEEVIEITLGHIPYGEEVPVHADVARQHGTSHIFGVKS